MIDRDLHDIVVPRHLRALMRGQFVRRTEAESSAVHVEHHRTLAGQARRPDVQLEHVLALPAVVPILDEGLLRARPGVQVLRAVRPIDQRRIFVRPRHGWLSGQPAVLAGRGLAVGNTLEGENTAVDKSAHFAVLRVGDRGARGRTVAGSLVGRRFDAVGSESVLAGRNAHACGGGKNECLAACQNSAV